MNINGLKLGTLIVALGTASVFSQDIKKTVPPPPLPPIPQASDAQATAARRAVILKRVELSRAARAAERTNELAQGAPGLTKGSESGGQTSAGQTSASTQPGGSGGQAPTVGSTAVVGLAPAVKASPAVGISPSPATAPEAKSSGKTLKP
jgi:hypothetical protein